MATIKQLTDAYAAVNAGRQPSPEILGQLTSLANLSVNGPISDAQALGYILNSADKTTSLALLSYQFFTGKSPTKEGLAYLTNSPDNPNDLNDAYYAGFSLEDRYINFAGNLATAGDSATAFAAKYGTLDFAAYVASIYETIVGGAYASAAGQDPAAAIAALVAQHDALLAKAQASGLITANSSAAQIDLALKAVTAGYLMSQTVQSDVGHYASAANNFMVAEIKGTATYNTDLATDYAAAPGKSGGDGHIAGSDFSFTPPPPPEPPKPPEPPVQPEPDPEPEPPAPVAQTFTLTTGADTFTGDGAGDTFNGTVSLTGSTVNPTSTFDPAADVLDGAGGYDTLALTLSGGVNSVLTLDPTKIRNIERLSVTSTAVLPQVVLTGTSFTELVANGSTSSFTFSDFGNSVTKLTIIGSSGASFTPDGAALAGTADAVTLSLTDVGTSSSSPIVSLTPSGGVSTDYYETLNLVSNYANGTANYVRIATGTSQLSLTRLNISGSAPLNLGLILSDNMRLVPTIDARDATGALTIGSSSVSLGAVDQTVILGSGANIVYFGANLNGNDTVDGSRGGNDTLAVAVSSGASTLDTSIFAHVTGVETLRVSGAPRLTQDLSALPTSITTLQLAQNAAVEYTLSKLANGMTVELLSTMGPSGVMALGLAANTASDALTLKFNASAVGTFGLATLNDIAGLETLNIVSAGVSTNTRITADQVTAKHVITGSNNFSITMATGVAGNIDASAFTGKLTFIASAGGSTVIGGTGADTLTGGSGVDTFTLGVKGSNFQSGADTIVLGNGTTDTVSFVGNTPTGTGAVTSYAALTNSAAISGTSGGNVAGVTLMFSADDHDFSLRNAAGNDFTGLAKGATGQGLSVGDTLVVQNLGLNAGALVAATNVALITLTGSTVSLTNSGSVSQMFADAIGSNTITGLAANGNYLVALYDNSSHKTVFGVVNVGASGAGDTTLSAADFTNSGVALVGHVQSSGLMANISLGVAF